MEERVIEPGEGLPAFDGFCRPDQRPRTDLPRHDAVAIRAIADQHGLLGFDGGALLGLVDAAVCVRTEKGAYELVEDIHSVICHTITRCLVADRPDPNR